MAKKEKVEVEEVVDRDNPTALWEMWEQVKAYQASVNLRKNIPTFVRFFEGDQWAKPTERTKNLPRPVVNFIKMICRNKKAGILSSVVKLVYKAEDEAVDTNKFTNFADYIMKEMRQADIDAEAVQDGVVKGSYFYHYYWDSEAKGKLGKKPGGVRCELIDILNIGFANPKERDEQKQKWIIIVTREEKDAILAKMDKEDKEVDADLIVEDEAESEYGDKEQEGSKLVTVITRYFRKDGEVYCERATKHCVINKPFPISPDVAGAMRIISKDDAPNSSMTDNAQDIEPMPTGKAYLYPIVVGNYEEREKSIYGLGEVEGLIPNQKAINFNLAMMLLSAQNNSWGKYVVSPDALKGQVIDNEPGQVLVDHSKTGGGIKKLEGTSTQNGNIQLINTIADLTRVVTGSTEVMTGEAISANMSGAAIAQLQSQAQMPIEELRDRFWRVKEKQGKVLEQFFKLYYENTEFTHTETQQVKNEKGVIEDKEVSQRDIFNGSEFAETEFTVVVESTAGTKSSAAGDINLLDNLLAKQMIDKKTYIKAYPKNALNNRTEILKAMEEEEQGQIQQLTQQLQEKDQQLQQTTALVAQQKEVVDKVVSVIQENNKLKTLLAALYTESKEKILQSNEIIKSLQSALTETEADATEFAQALYGGGNGMRQV